MNAHAIDWLIMAGFAAALIGLAAYTRRYARSVADFLAANRCAGRYLLTISQGMTGLGAISVVACFEMYYRAGFTAAWWQMCILPFMLVVTVSGWVVYRYRETRALTLAQFFEVRYSRRFRIFCGILAWVSGVINMGIFPAVTANFFIYFLGLPERLIVLGLPVSTFAALMVLELSVAVALTLMGGMVVVAITDAFQGIFANAAFLLILCVIFWRFDWSQIIAGLQAAPADASMINPFHTSGEDDFNVAYFLMNAFYTIYIFKAWQGGQGYNAAAANAHEARMAGILAQWRDLIQGLLILMLPICAFALLHHPGFAADTRAVQQVIGQIANPQLQEQMTVPLALTHILPAGMIGLFAAVMMAAAISTDDTYMHSWGSIFIQDVILPFRKQGFTPAQHIWLLRASVILVAVIIFVFSLVFRQTDYIFMFFAITGAIYLGGAGAVIIGGLYWRHGSTGGAWGGMIVGCVLAVGGIVLQKLWPTVQPILVVWFPHSRLLADHLDRCPWNGMEINFFAICCAIAAYISLSLFDLWVLRRPGCNMQRLLHRGPYAVPGDHADRNALPPTGLRALLPSSEFSRSDKVIYYALIVWVVGWYGFFLGVNGYHYFIRPIGDMWWSGFWWFHVVLTAVLGSVTTVWFLCGASIDMTKMLRALRAAKIDMLDDGRVVEPSIPSDQLPHPEAGRELVPFGEEISDSPSATPVPSQGVDA